MSGDAYFTPCSLLGMWVDRRGSDDKLQSAVLSYVRDDAESVGEKKKKKNERWGDFSAKIGGSSFYFMMIFFFPIIDLIMEHPPPHMYIRQRTHNKFREHHRLLSLGSMNTWSQWE